MSVSVAIHRVSFFSHFALFPISQVLERKVPWYPMDHDTISKALAVGSRPPITTALINAHPEYVRLMQRCWSQRPEDRPSFPEVFIELEKMCQKEAMRTGNVHVVSDVCTSHSDGFAMLYAVCVIPAYRLSGSMRQILFDLTCCAILPQCLVSRALLRWFIF